MAINSINDMDGPIPGENFTSDTKNYPWHRPPKFTDLDEAVEDMVKGLTNKNNTITLLTMIKAGLPINVLARTYVISGVGNGKWTVDYAMLLVGPTARVMMMLADGADIKYDLGLKDDTPPTLPFLEFTGGVDEQDAADAIDNVETPPVRQQGGGFMSQPDTLEEGI